MTRFKWSHWVLAGIAFFCFGRGISADELPQHAVLRLGTNAFSHGSYIQEIVVIPESSQYITIGSGEARVWDKSGSLVRSVSREPNLRNISFSMDGRWRLGTVSLPDPDRRASTQWFHVATNLVTGAETRSKAVRFPAYSMCISADGKLLAVGDPGAALLLIDNSTGDVLSNKILPGSKNHAGYPRTFLTPDAALLLAEQPDGEWYVFDLKDRNLSHPLPGFDNCRNAKPVFSSRKGIGAMIGWNGRIVIRDFYHGKDLVEFQHGNVTALDGAFSPDDETLATCGADGFIRIWDAAAGRLLQEINTEERHPNCVAFEADGKTLVSGGGQGRVRFWNLPDGIEKVYGRGPGFGAIKSVAMSPNGRTAALASGLGEITVWDLQTGVWLGELPDKDIQGGPFDPWVGHNFMAFTRTGVLVAGSSNRHNSVNVWDVTTRQRIARVVGHAWPITCVACSPDGKSIVSGSRDKSVCAWSASGQGLWQAIGNGAQILTLAFAPDGKQVFSAGHTNTIDVWNAKNGKPAEPIVIKANDKQRHLNAISALAVSGDGKYIAAVLGESTSGRRVVVIQLDAKEAVLEIPGEPEDFNTSCKYYCVAFNPGRGVLAVGTGDGDVALYQMTSGKIVRQLKGHTSAVTSVAWSSDGERLVSGSTDGTAVLWNTALGLASN